jgi:indolepyruvate ferredoxin oxidoreductase beta subunit
MKGIEIKMQQIIVSGVGGQGVLFITKLLAETALDMGYSALISETHGMAQRGGNVISHLKIGKRAEQDTRSDTAGTAASSRESVFVSPLIRPGRADVLLSLHSDALLAHGFYLKPKGEAFCNCAEAGTSGPEMDACKSVLDAGRIAAEIGSPISANLVLLGFAVGSGKLFCTPEQLENTLKRYSGKRLEMSLKAFLAGVAKGAETRVASSCPGN